MSNQISRIVEDICDYYDKGLSYIDEYTYGSGELSSAMGLLYQNTAIYAIRKINPHAVCKHNDYITKWSKSGRYYNDRLQVDLHVYLKGELKFLLESKTYFDSSHIKRTIVDFNEIRSVVGNIPAIVWSGQNAMSRNAEGYFREDCDFDYYVINQTKKRNSSYPPHRTKDPLDKNVIMSFLCRVNQILNGA